MASDNAILQQILMSLLAQEERHNNMQKQLTGLIAREQERSTSSPSMAHADTAENEKTPKENMAHADTTPRKQPKNDQSAEAHTTAPASPQLRRSPRNRKRASSVKKTPVYQTDDDSDSATLERTSSLSKSLKEKEHQNPLLSSF